MTMIKPKKLLASSFKTNRRRFYACEPSVEADHHVILVGTLPGPNPPNFGSQWHFGCDRLNNLQESGHDGLMDFPNGIFILHAKICKASNHVMKNNRMLRRSREKYF